MWKTKTIQEYQDILGILGSTLLTDYIKYLNIIACLEKKEVDWVEENFTAADFERYIQTLGWLNTAPEPDDKFKPTQYINGKKYKFTLEVNKLTASRYIDICEISAQNNLIQDLPIIMALLSDSTNIDEAITDMKQLEITTALGILNFFFRSLMRIINSTRTSLISQLKALHLRIKIMRWLRLKPRQQDLDGCELLMQLLNKVTDLTQKYTKLHVPNS